jgi:hypothetical protein
VLGIVGDPRSGDRPRVEVSHDSVNVSE